MSTAPFTRGMTIIEAIVAIAVFSLIASVSFGAYTEAQALSLHAANKSKAVWLAEEGVEATRSIRDQSFANLTAGTKGLSTTTGAWQFSGTSDVTDSFTRAVAIAVVDANTRTVQSTVSWTEHGVSNSVTLSSTLTNWHKVADSVASHLTFDVSGACLLSSNTQYLGGIKIIYDGALGAVTIPQVKISWSPTSKNLSQIYAAYPGTSVWTGAGASAATTTLTTPMSLPQATTLTTVYKWEASVTGKTFTISVAANDGSIKTVSVPTPAQSSTCI